MSNTKRKTIEKHMPQRQVFNSLESAVAKLTEIQEYEGFDSLQKIIGGLDDKGNIDPDFYPDGWDVYLVKLNQKLEGTGFVPKALIMWPVPTLDLLMSTDSGREMVAATLETELNTRLVRNLRTAENVALYADKIPSTLENWSQTGRDSAGSIYESYNEVWSTLNKGLKQASKLWSTANLGKAQVRKAMESKAFAEQMFPALENAAKGSLFVFAIHAGKHIAAQNGLDTDLFDTWLASRDSTVISVDEPESDDEALDLETMFAEPDADADAEEPETPASE